MTYYDDLVNDKKRVSAFKDVILNKSHGIVYDLGTGSGILASFAAGKAQHVFAVEINPLILKHTKANLEKFPNVDIINTDATTYKLDPKADVIICEMLDTALIDEEQIPVINNAIKYIKPTTTIIPKGVENTIELIKTNINHITYYEDNHPKYTPLSDKITYNSIEFNKTINPNVDTKITITPTDNNTANAIKLTTNTILTDEVKLEPTPMLNPPLLIPLNQSINVKKDEKIEIQLKYEMGGGLDTITANIITT